MRDGMHKTAITMPKEMWLEVQELAKDNGLTANAFMVLAVKKYMKQTKAEKDTISNFSDPKFIAQVMSVLAEKMGSEDGDFPLLDTIETTDRKN